MKLTKKQIIEKALEIINRENLHDGCCQFNFNSGAVECNMGSVNKCLYCSLFSKDIAESYLSKD